jgi:hypothetical protein
MLRAAAVSDCVGFVGLFALGTEKTPVFVHRATDSTGLLGRLDVAVKALFPADEVALVAVESLSFCVVVTADDAADMKP